MTSERTPLLEQRVAGPQLAPLLPSLRRAGDSLSSHQLITTKHLRDVVPDEATPTSLTHLYAFLFAIPLYMELLGLTAHMGASQSHISVFHNSHELIEELWTSYSESRLGNSVSPRIYSDLNVQELLWTSILAEDEGDNGPEFTSGKLSTPCQWAAPATALNHALSGGPSRLSSKSLPPSRAALCLLCPRTVMEVWPPSGPCNTARIYLDSNATKTLSKREP
jgi:hypothetical protein